MCLLLGLKIAKFLYSTGCAEHPRRAVRSFGFGASSGGEKWELMDDDMLASLISETASTLETKQPA